MTSWIRSFAALALLTCSSPAWADDTKLILDVSRLDVNKLIKEASEPPQRDCSASIPLPAISCDKEQEEQWTKAGFGNPRILILNENGLYGPPRSKTFTHQITLTAVVLRNAGWKVEQVKTRLKRVAAIYQQCGIKIAQATIVEADAPTGKVDIEGAYDRTGFKLDLAKATPNSHRPALYYVRSSKSKDPDTAFAQPEYFTGKDSPLLNTAWITAEVNSASYKKIHASSYSVEAHELGHVLGNVSHYMGPGKNFLSDLPDLLNDQIKPEQCEQMKKHSLMKPL